MLQLHQFRHSAFCEKVRLVLAAKQLHYTVVEVLPGLGQLQLFRLSGQRQVPVLVDGAAVVADSTAIALHLEQRQPAPALLPADPAQRARVLLLEDWADTTLAAGCRLALVQAAAADPVLRTALLPEATPAPLPWAPASWSTCRPTWNCCLPWWRRAPTWWGISSAWRIWRWRPSCRC